MPLFNVTEQEAQLGLWVVLGHAFYRFKRVITQFGNALTALNTPSTGWGALSLKTELLARIALFQQQAGEHYKLWQHTLNQWHSNQIKIIFASDPSYPPLLNEIDQPPPLLFARGNLEALQRPQIAIVGTRKPSVHGREITTLIAGGLVEAGFYITSGLAQGIDRVAHLGAVCQETMHSIAVLGTGVDVCYPTANKDIYDRLIADGGLVLSEFNLGTPPLSFNFPRRNRIVSGLSLGVVVTEAALESGSLITARLALEQNRLVFAVPGSPFNKQVQGCHALIREGATLVDSAAHVVQELNLPKASNSAGQVPSAPNKEKTVPPHLQPLYRLLDWQTRSLDEVAKESSLDIATINAHLTELELLDLVVEENGRYARLP